MGGLFLIQGRVGPDPFRERVFDPDFDQNF